MKGMTNWLALSLLLPVSTLSQQPGQPTHLTGKLRSKNTNEILAGVTISNHNLGQHNISDLGGNYRIPARPGDTLIFTSAGYHPDSVVVSASMLGAETTIYLRPNIVAMPSVKVSETNYQRDSIQRREENALLLNKKHPVKLWNEKRPGDGPGLSFSPIGYFSKEELRKRRLKKRLQQQEEDYYIDSKFTRPRVAALTGLQGDSLNQFMIRYRPTYKFCRAANGEDMLLYINDKLVLYRKGTPATPAPATPTGLSPRAAPTTLH